MNRYILTVPIVATGLVLAATAAFSQQQESIPDWVKNSAGWWSEGAITDADYINSIQWLVDAGYIVLGGQGTGEADQILQISWYAIEQPDGWERQIPVRNPVENSIRDAMVASSTINEQVPAIISVQAYPIQGANMTEHREWGLGLVSDVLGDAFTHISASEVTVAGNPGYTDEYSITIDELNLSILGKSYSFAHEGHVYEIKYEADAKFYDDHLAEFEGMAQSFRLD